MSRPQVLVHCGWPRDRELVGRMLRALGAECRPLEGVPDLRQLVAADGIDLILADSAGGHGPLGELLRVLDEQPGAGDLPLLLLADTSDVDLLAELTARRFNATLLTKPVEPEQLAASVRAGLRYWAGRRENRRLIAELEAAHNRYHDLVHGLDAIVWEADAATGRLTFLSRRAEEWFGGPAARWPDLPDAWLGCIVPDDREYARDARRRGVADGRDFELEYRAVATDGRTIWVHESARVARDGRGRPVGLRGLVRDITRRKKVERQLYKAKAALAEQLADMNHLHRTGSACSPRTDRKSVV